MEKTIVEESKIFAGEKKWKIRGKNGKIPGKRSEKSHHLQVILISVDTKFPLGLSASLCSDRVFVFA